MKYLFFALMMALVGCSGTSIESERATEVYKQIELLQTEKRLIAKNRHAVVRIYSLLKGGAVGLGTGTIFEYKGENIVLTAAHVIGSPESLYAVAVMGFPVDSEIIYYDSDEDIAILRLKNKISIRPMSFYPTTKSQLKIGDETLYSGYPNNDSLFSIKGYVAGLFASGNISIHSYAWPGSSGSSVFDKRGRLIGVLSAISVGDGVGGAPTAIEDIVVVVPIWKVDFEQLDSNFP
jgi:S1-C subfamily serine protease